MNGNVYNYLTNRRAYVPGLGLMVGQHIIKISLNKAYSYTFVRFLNIIMQKTKNNFEML